MDKNILKIVISKLFNAVVVATIITYIIYFYVQGEWFYGGTFLFILVSKVTIKKSVTMYKKGKLRDKMNSLIKKGGNDGED